MLLCTCDMGNQRGKLTSGGDALISWGKWFFSFASGIVFFESSLSILLRMGEGHIYADVTVVVIQYICSLTSTQPPTFDHAIHVHFVQGCYLYLLICLADVNILGCICLPKINPQTFLFHLCRFLLKKYMCVLARWTLAQDLACPYFKCLNFFLSLFILCFFIGRN